VTPVDLVPKLAGGDTLRHSSERGVSLFGFWVTRRPLPVTHDPPRASGFGRAGRGARRRGCDRLQGRLGCHAAATPSRLPRCPGGRGDRRGRFILDRPQRGLRGHLADHAPRPCAPGGRAVDVVRAWVTAGELCPSAEATTCDVAQASVSTAMSSAGDGGTALSWMAPAAMPISARRSGGARRTIRRPRCPG